jgi:hypothetical protein
LLKKSEPYLALAKRLREDAQHLREYWSADSEVEAHVAAIDAAVTFHKNKTKKLFKPLPRLVDRDQGDRYQRAYAVYMANYARWLFGKYVYGTIAKVTNVALVKANKKEVSDTHVRDWCAASVRVKARFSAREF